MADAGDTLGGVPLIGGGIRAPFDAASGAGGLLAQAGQAQVDLVDTAALVIAIVGGGGADPRDPVGLAAAARAVSRGARPGAYRISQLADGVAAAGAARADRRGCQELHRVAERPVEAWRHGEVTVVRALAALELREAGRAAG